MMKKLILLCAALLFSSVAVFANLPQTGMATFYATNFHNHKTASGERYNMDSLTAAHPSLPFGTYVRVTNLANNKSVIVRINDRGPNKKGRIIDLSTAAARKIDMIGSGVAKVRLELASWAKPKNEEPKKESPSGEPIVKNKPDNNTVNDRSVTLNQDKKGTQSGGFALQAGAFKVYDNALKSKADLAHKGIDKLVIKTDNSRGENIYKVLVGPFATRDEAEEMMRKLKEQSVAAFVIKQ